MLWCHFPTYFHAYWHDSLIPPSRVYPIKYACSVVWFTLLWLCRSSYAMMTSSNGNIFPRNWLFVREIHRSPVNFPHKGQWRGALMFSLIYASINDWVNNREAGDLKHQHGHYDVIVMHIYWHSSLSINPLRAKFFRENIDIYLHFMSFLHINKTQVVEIPPWVRQWPAYST